MDDDSCLDRDKPKRFRYWVGLWIVVIAYAMAAMGCVLFLKMPSRAFGMLRREGLLPTWLFLVSAFFHFAGIIQNAKGKDRSIPTPSTANESEQTNNPYAPPMQTKSSLKT